MISKKIFLISICLLSLKSAHAMTQSLRSIRPRAPQLTQTATSYFKPQTTTSSQLYRFMSHMTRQEAEQILNLKGNPSVEEIKKQYRKLALKFHPDVSSVPPEAAHVMMKKINQARDTLLNPSQNYNSMYDQTHRAQEEQQKAREAEERTYQEQKKARGQEWKAYEGKRLKEAMWYQGLNRAIAGAALGRVGYVLWQEYQNYKKIKEQEKEEYTQLKSDLEKHKEMSDFFEITNYIISIRLLLNKSFTSEHEKYELLSQVINYAFKGGNLENIENNDYLKAQALICLAYEYSSYKKLIQKELKKENQTYTSKFGITPEQLTPENLYGEILKLPKNPVNESTWIVAQQELKKIKEQLNE